MEYISLQATCNTSGAGTATGSYVLRGTVQKVVVAYSTTAATTCDVTFRSYNTTLGTENFLIVSNTNGDASYYPRAAAVSVNNTADSAYGVEFIVDGLPVMEVAQGGSGAVVTGHVMIFEIP